MLNYFPFAEEIPFQLASWLPDSRISGTKGSCLPDSNFTSAIENRFQRKIWIEMIGSQPIAIEEC